MVLELIGNATVLPPAAWHPEPNIRGTFGILSSCLITMSLCVWTTLHLNLPAHKDGEQLKFWRKTKWFTIGLLAPEIVVWNAWSQRKEMKELSDTMRDEGYMPEKVKRRKLIVACIQKVWGRLLAFLLIKARDPPEIEKPHCNGRLNSWTDVHSWLILMGGLAFEDNAPEELQFMSKGRQRVTLTNLGFRAVLRLEPGLIPDISRQQIEDKSKSDGLAKALTWWQASYFCVQTIFRLSQRLSVTLLLINVFAHALCALLLLVIWWDKPRDVQEPTLITDEKGLDICGLFCFQSDQNKWNGPCGKRSQWKMMEPCLDFWEVREPTVVTLHDSPGYCGDSECIKSPRFGPLYQPSIKIRDTFWTIRMKVYPHNVMSFTFDRMVCKVDSRTLRRLVRAHKLIDKSAGVNVGSATICDRPSNWGIDLDGVLNRMAMGGDSKANRGSKFLDMCWLAARITFAGVCYGGLHVIAWDLKFPSFSETVLWRAASVTIMATGPLICLPLLCVAISFETYEWMDRKSVLEKYIPYETFQSCIIAGVVVAPACLGFLLALWYILCRAFIVVECFIMLAHIQDTALHVPEWARYTPNIS